MHWWALLGVVLAGYAIGSIPFGYLVARWVAGIDIRQHGSGNVGATNVGRVVGRGWGWLVLGLDAAKGLLPVGVGWYAYARSFASAGATNLPWYGQPISWAALAGLAAIAGHLWPVGIGFRGGKGVATGVGVFLGLSTMAPELMGPAVVAAAVAWGIVAALSRYVSLASMLAAVMFVAAYLATVPQPVGGEHLSLTVVSLATAALVLWRHRSNVIRLWRREEPRLGQYRYPPTDAGRH